MSGEQLYYVCLGLVSIAATISVWMVCRSGGSR